MKHKTNLAPAQQANKQDEIIAKLDLSEHINALAQLYARPKDLALFGDVKIHLERISELDKFELNLPAALADCTPFLQHLGKQGVLHLLECAEFFKIIEYFLYLASKPFSGSLRTYLDKIIIPPALINLRKYFKNGEFVEENDEELCAISANIKSQNAQISQILHSIAKKYPQDLIDTQLHLVSNYECLLAKSGYGKNISASVINRSAKGGFYILPDQAKNIYERIESLQKAREEILYKYAKTISETLAKNLKFLNFINKEFDLIDAYVARSTFAKTNDLLFFAPSNGEFELKEFNHPALKNPKPINVSLDKNVLIVTGVNAGGKSMLLKSVLAASFMCKYLVPFRAQPHSKIATFKDYFAIISDPQDSANNISTFAGRMRSFSQVFDKKGFLLGIDEIELGTDFEEAAVLFYELVTTLQNRGKIIITTHHKRLAMLLAAKPFVQLLAALYDEEKEQPKYEFLDGIIGKSYAFETAAKYGIPASIIAQANRHFSEHEKSLNEMINKNLELDAKLKMQLAQANKYSEQAKKHLEQLKHQQEQVKIRAKELEISLQRRYLEAINEAKKTLDFSELKDKQRQINAAHLAFCKAQTNNTPKSPKVLKIGDRVKYENLKATLVAVGKKQATIEANGIKMRVDISALERSNAATLKSPSPCSVKISTERPASASLKLDLHGLRVEEALDKCDKFISDALLAGFSEVLIYHGIGTGKLARAVREFLTKHPKVSDFADAAPNQGGFGAKIVRF